MDSFQVPSSAIFFPSTRPVVRQGNGRLNGGQVQHWALLSLHSKKSGSIAEKRLMGTLVEKVEQYIQENQLLRAGESVLVGVSGGADSVCLLLTLLELSREGGLGLTLSVGHLDHCIRGQKGRSDAQFVAELAQKLDLPVYSESVDVPALAAELNVALETAARQARD